MTYTYAYEGMVVIVHYYTIKQDPGCPFKLYACKCRDVSKKNYNQLEIILIRNKDSHLTCRLYVVLIPHARVLLLIYMHKPKGPHK